MSGPLTGRLRYFEHLKKQGYLNNPRQKRRGYQALIPTGIGIAAIIATCCTCRPTFCDFRLTTTGTGITVTHRDISVGTSATHVIHAAARQKKNPCN